MGNADQEIKIYVMWSHYRMIKMEWPFYSFSFVKSNTRCRIVNVKLLLLINYLYKKKNYISNNSIKKLQQMK